MPIVLQIAKIVGQPEGDFWSQVHTFFPKEKKREEYGNLLLAISLKKKTEDELDLSSYGKEVIQRFHETYFSSEKKRFSNKLKEAVDKLGAEFSQELELVLIAGVVYGDALYLIRKGKARAFIKRGAKKTLIFSSSKEKVASGRLRPGDSLVLATSWFFENVSLKLLAEVFTGPVQEVAEELTAQVSAGLNSTRVAALLVQVVASKGEKKEAFQFPRPEIELGKVKELLGRLKKKLSQILPSTRELYLKRQKGEFKKSKRIYLFLAIFLISLLFLSIFLQSKQKNSKSEDENLAKAFHFYEEAESLVMLNPLRARELLEQAGALLGEGKVNEKQEEELKKEIRLLKEKVAREYKIEASQVFQDLGLLREGTVGQDLGLAQDQLLIFDKNAGVVLTLNISTKSGGVLVANLKEADFVAVTDTWGFAVSGGQILGGALESSSWEKLKDKDWEKVIDIKGFANNLYLLDKSGQILKFAAIEGGLADKSDYLKEEADFSESASLAIDGSVWILEKNGKIKKFTRGIVDAFTILGLDKPFSSPEVLYTDETLENLYILDKNNTRVVVLSKSGEYQAQYVWGGLAGVEDLVASEELGKILLLSRDKIYEIEIRD